jgi:hypothetical protein
MPFPNGGLITETNRQYYEGAQGFQVSDPVTADTFPCTFNTNLFLGNWDPLEPDYELNNFKLYYSPAGPGNGVVYTEYTSVYYLEGNTVRIGTESVPVYLNTDDIIVVQLKSVNGGNYGNQDAYGRTVEENYGSYAYMKLNDIINNFMAAYVGTGKLIGNAKRTDIIFHAKRALQEFSYDTLKSIKIQELSIPNNLSVPLPQDYVNYVKLSFVDSMGITHRILPTSLTLNPTEMPIQDNLGVPIQSSFDDNIEGTAIIEERWNASNGLAGSLNSQYPYGWQNYDWGYGDFYGRRYGIDPQHANINGSFTINDRENKINFSSDLVGLVITFEYISDGLAYDLDSRIPKMAEEAAYAYILHAVISTRANQPEYLVNRLHREKSAKLRNAKIRLSNIKLEEITQVMRGKSKWIKH